MAMAGLHPGGGFSAQNFHHYYTTLGAAMAEAFAANPATAEKREKEIKKMVEE
jgi:hypothetical protein